jgi:hypothetical protein
MFPPMRIRRSRLLLLAALPLLVGGTARPEALPEGDDFGAGLTLVRPTPLAEIMHDPARFAGENVLIHGQVTEVCQKKGCWAVIREGDEHVRVRFKDYGFFLPKDCVGAKAYAQGSISVGTPSEREVIFIATGVRLVGGD